MNFRKCMKAALVLLPWAVSSYIYSSVASANTNDAITQEQVSDLVRQLDQYRGYENKGFQFSITNVSYKKDTPPKQNQLSVKVLGDQSLVTFESPARDKGRALLKEGKNMWLSIPGTSRVIRIAPSQRLIGETSNADVVGTQFSIDYESKWAKNEEIDGIDYWVVALTAKERSQAYQTIHVWFSQESDHKPLKSEFYTRSGKRLKTAFYKDFKDFAGVTKLHKLLLIDGLIASNYTWMKFDGYELQELDEAYFQKSTLSQSTF